MVVTELLVVKDLIECCPVAQECFEGRVQHLSKVLAGLGDKQVVQFHEGLRHAPVSVANHFFETFTKDLLEDVVLIDLLSHLR